MNIAVVRLKIIKHMIEFIIKKIRSLRK